MNTLSFFVPGEPKAQPRPRAFARKFGNKWQARVYDAGTAENWKSQIAIAAKGLVAGPLTGPVRLSLQFCLTRPKAHYRKNGTVLRDEAPTWHTAKPDLDNLEKAVKDALTQIGVWLDDSQVCDKHTTKIYTSFGMMGCAVRITPLPNDGGQSNP